MRSLAVHLWALALLLAGCEGKGGLLAPKYEDEGVQWGEAVGGLQAGLARRTYVEGKAPGRGQEYFALHLRNVGKRDVSVLSPVAAFGTIPEDLGGDETVAVSLTYDSAAGVKNGEFKPSKKPVVRTLEPGAGFRMELRLAPSRFGLDRFVAGRLTATYTNAQEAIRYASVGDAQTRGLWVGSVSSGYVAVEAGGAERKQNVQRPTPNVQHPAEDVAAARVGGGE